MPSGFQHAVFCFPHQAILNNDETTYLLENLEPDTPYDVSVTAIYPDESESEDLLGTERTCKIHNSQQRSSTITMSKAFIVSIFCSISTKCENDDERVCTDLLDMCSKEDFSSCVQLLFLIIPLCLPL